MPKRYAAPFELKIDLKKSYTATIETNRGFITVEALRRTSAAHGEQLRLPGARRLL